MQIIDETSELEELRPAWSALWNAVADASPFQHPAWLLPWWRFFGGTGLCTLALRDGGELRALAPLFLHTGEEAGNRQLTLLGNGIWDTLGFLIHPSAAAPELKSLLLEAIRDRVGWESADLRDLPASHSWLHTSAPAGVRATIDFDTPCPVLVLPDSGEGFEAMLRPGFHRKLRYARRRAARLGAIRTERAHGSGLGAALDTFFRLHARRWEDRGETGVLDDARLQAFHREAASSLERAGLLRLDTLWIGEEAAASVYAFHSHRRTWSYLGGFEPRLAGCSPLKLLILHSIESAIGEGARAFDFLRGREAYKYAWGARDREQYRVRWTRASSSGGGTR